MKFILAPDKFKGSLTGIQFCKEVEKSLKQVLPHSEILSLPLSDGGDGTIDVLEYHLKGTRLKIKVNDPLFRKVEASYLYMEAIKTAFIEMAEASGMALLKEEERNCYHTTSYGTGEIILDAMRKGAQTIILGIGGSATNDCGIGMASALGYRFEDEKGNPLIPVGRNLSLVKNINTANVISELKNVSFKVACDVTNPLFGKNGAAYVYGPQKGASEEEVTLLDEGLQHISKLFKQQLAKDIENVKGAGAAGGMGAGSLVFLNTKLQSGINLVKQLIDFDKKIKQADWIITGEGKLDSQTLSGKTIQGVIASSKAENIKVAALCGSVDLSAKEAKEIGISYSDSVLSKAKNLEDAMKNSGLYLSMIAKKFAEEIKV
jgi:glycerate kinase